MPRPAALRAKSAVRSGERCADVTSISYAMPNSSSALPASRMISRSESLPITIETSGLLIAPSLKVFLPCHPERRICFANAKQTGVEGSLLPWRGLRFRKEFPRRTRPRLLLQRPPRNILAVMRPVKTNLRASFVSAPDCRLQVPRPRSYSQHAAARSVINSIALRRPRMKHLHPLDSARFFESVDSLPYFVRSRISARRHHHANRSVLRPLEIPFAHAPLNRSLQRLGQVALQPHQNRLRLRIAKAAVELQHHRPTRRHHQPAVEHTLKLRVLGLHTSNHGLRNVMHQPVAHLVIDNVRR